MSLVAELESGSYSAVERGEVVYRGGVRDVASYIASALSTRRNVQADTEDTSELVKARRLLYIENLIELEPVGFRLQQATGLPGIYGEGLFKTRSAALEYQINTLGDMDENKFEIVEANWRGALL